MWCQNQRTQSQRVILHIGAEKHGYGGFIAWVSRLPPTFTAALGPCQGLAAATGATGSNANCPTAVGQGAI